MPVLIILAAKLVGLGDGDLLAKMAPRRLDAENLRMGFGFR